MASTQITGRQIADGSIERSDINISAAGKALIRKIIVTPSTGLTISSYTGADSGTGDVTLAIDTNTIATRAWVQAQGYLTSNDGYISNVVLQGNNLQFTGIGNAFSGNVNLSSLIPTEVDTLATVTSRGAVTSTPVTFNSNVTLGNNADLVFQDLAGVFPTTGKGFDWTLNNDGARIYAIQPSSDSIDFVFQLRDNATTNDRFVFWVQEWRGAAFDKYPLIIRGGTEFDLVDSGLFVRGTQVITNGRVLQNVSGNISMFTNDSAYITAAALAGYATQTYVNTQIANLVDSAPSTLDTLNELAAALGDDPNFATTVTNSIATKVPQSRTLTINGVSYDLSANRSWTISTADGYIQDVQLVGNELRFAGVGSAFTGNIDLTQLGYLTTFTETDPTVPAHVKSITTTEKSNWNTAYSWGNHASAGYLTSLPSHNHDSLYVKLDGTSIVQNTLNINSNEMGGTARSWMTRGVVIGGGGSDGAYFGMKVIGANNAQTVIAWGDDSGDDLHFINTISGGPVDGVTYMTFFGSQNTIRMYKQLDVQSTIYSAEGNSSQWSTAYSWGNHASVGYLTSFSETDPTVPAHVKSITTTNISNWNTAYGWGNHASAGYQPASTAITTSNIGSQSVNYANSAGSASSLSSNGDYFVWRGNGAGSSIDTYTDNGFRTLSYTGYSSQLWSVNSGGSTGTVQFELEYNTPVRGFKVRNKTDNSSWSSVGWVVMTTSNQGHISGTIATQSWVQSQGYLTSVSDVWVNTSGDTMTGALTIQGGWASTILDGDNVVLRKPNYSSGGWARTLLNFQEYTGTSLFQIGGYGSNNTMTYGYLGSAYNTPTFRWYADKTVVFDGLVGIGVIPASGDKVEIAGTLRVHTGNNWDGIQIYADGQNGYIRGLGDEIGLHIRSEYGNVYIADDRGVAGVGGIHASYKFNVEGAVRITGALVLDDTTSNVIQHRAGTDVNTLVTVGHGGFDHNGYLRIGGADVATRNWVQSQGYITSVSDVWVNTAGDTMTGELVFSMSAPQIRFADTDHYDHWIHVNSNRFYILSDRNGDGGWETPYPLELNSENNTGYVFSEVIATRPWVTSQGYLTSLPAHNHDGVYLPINPDGDGPAWSYADENPTINGKYVGGGQRFGADGNNLTGGFLQARHINAYDGHINSSDGYFVGLLEYGANSGTHVTTQVIDSAGRWVGVAIADNKIASSGNWNTAYSWGNHASAGYATQSWVNSQGFLTSVSDVWVNTTGDTMTGDLRFNQGAGYGRIAYADNYHGMILRGIPNNAAGDVTVGDYTSLIQHSGDFRFYRTNGSINELYFQVNASAAYWRGNTIWHSGNDGAGSGLDADTLDGFNSAQAGGDIILRTASNGYLYINNWIHPANGTGLFYDSGPHFYESGGQMFSSHALRVNANILITDAQDNNAFVKGSSFLNLRDPWNNLHMRQGSGGGQYFDANHFYLRSSDGGTNWLYLDASNLNIYREQHNYARVTFRYNTDRYSQSWYNTTTGAYWWVTTDSGQLGFHRNGDGDKFYFSNGGDFYSSTNGWLSTALAGKSNTGHTHDDRYYTESESDARYQPIENQRLSTSNSPTFAGLTINGGVNAYAGVIRLNEIRFTDTAGSTASDPYTMRWVSESSARGAGLSWLEFQLNDDSNEEIRIYGNSCVGYGCGTYSENLYHRFRADGYAWHAGDLEVGGTITENSSIRYKENVRPLESVSDKIAKVAPVRYNKKGGDTEEIGFIAEDMAIIYPEVVKFDAEGRPDGINYTRLSAILIKAVQELTNKVNELEKKA